MSNKIVIFKNNVHASPLEIELPDRTLVASRPVSAKEAVALAESFSTRFNIDENLTIEEKKELVVVLAVKLLTELYLSEEDAQFIVEQFGVEGSIQVANDFFSKVVQAKQIDAPK